MKYYHIIYNSSQRTQNGSVGLGVRTYTEGMPKEFIETLRANGLFGYSSGSLPQPLPMTLLENPSAILQFPVTYQFVKLFAPDTGKEFYVISRSVSVGFDYPYYVEFTAARLGNMVVDTYVFEDCPDMEVMQMLYENPLENGNGFVPRNRVPSPDNEEMKGLSLGQMSLLPSEEKTFAAADLPPVSDLAIELLFAFIEAKRQKKPLLVNCKDNEAPRLMADLIRLLPTSLQKDAFFYTNYQSDGVKDGYSVFFVNEFNKYDYSQYGHVLVFDITKKQRFASVESETYRKDFIQFAHEGNMSELTKHVEWMMGPVYASIRGGSDEVKHMLYSYVVEPSTFKMQMVYKGDEQEMWAPLKAFFSQDKNNQQLFDKLLLGYLNSADIQGTSLLTLLKFVNRLSAFGFDTSGIVNNSKRGVSEKLLQTTETMVEACESIGIRDLEKYFDKSTFEVHEAYLDEKVMGPYWAKLYKWFYPAEKQNDKVGIIARMFDKVVPQDVVDEVIRGFGMDDQALCSCYAEVAKKDPALVDYSWKYIKDCLKRMLDSHMPLPTPQLASSIENNVILPLMKDQERPDGLVECQKLMALLQGRFTRENFDTLYKVAMCIGTKQSATILYEKGMGYLREDIIDAFIHEIVEKVNPTKEEFLVKIEDHPLEMQLMKAWFKATGESKKSIEKMKKAGMLSLSSGELEKLEEELFGKRKGGQKDGEESKGIRGFFKKIKGMPFVVKLLVPIVILLIVGAVVFICVRNNHGVKGKADTESFRNDSVIQIDSANTKVDTIAMMDVV